MKFATSAQMQLGSVMRSELVWVIIVSILIILLSSLPYIAGYLSETPELDFNGAVYDRSDYAVHVATMQLGHQGNWKYNLLFSGQPQQGAYVKLGYIFLGHVSRWINLSVENTYQLARLIFGFTNCLMVYLIATWVFKEQFWRKSAFLLAVLGSGLGWLQSIFRLLPHEDISPIDFWLIDGYNFFGIMTFPHFSAVTTLLLVMILAWLLFLLRGSWVSIGVIVFSGILIQGIQPYAPILADLGILGAFLIYSFTHRKMDWKAMMGMVVIGTSQLPLLSYNWWVFSSSNLWRGFAEQNVTLSPPLSYYAWGYGLILPLAVFGLVVFIGKLRLSGFNSIETNPASILVGSLASWTIGALILAYIPWNLQRRFTLGYSIPLGFIAIYGLRYGSGNIKHLTPVWIRKKGRSIAGLYIGMASITSFLLCFSGVLLVSQTPASLFDNESLVKAADWLATQAGYDDVILSSETSGLLIAARTGRPVYVGHPIESLDYSIRLDQVQGYYSGSFSSEWLVQANVDWVLYGPSEMNIGGANFSPDLAVAYRNKEVLVYKVGQ